MTRRITPRERRTIVAGAVVSAVALGVAYGALPFARRWSAREELIAARRGELARLRTLAAHEPALRQALAEREARAAVAPRRVLAARTAALAASTLQTTLRSWAESAPLAVSSLDVSGEPDSAATGALPATLTALGDVQAVGAFLEALRRGPLLVEVRELHVRPNNALRGEPLQLTLTLAAPWVQEESR